MAKTHSARGTAKVQPKRRIRSASPLKQSTRKRLAQRRPKSTAKSTTAKSTTAKSTAESTAKSTTAKSTTAKSTATGRPGKAATKKRMQLEADLKAILLEKTHRQDLRKDFDMTNRYTLGTRGHQFTNLAAIDLNKLRNYIENDEALNDQQFWQDYDQSSLKLSMPPKRKRELKVSDLKTPTARDNKNLYTYVLGCIQEKMAQGYFAKS